MAPDRITELLLYIGWIAELGRSHVAEIDFCEVLYNSKNSKHIKSTHVRQVVSTQLKFITDIEFLLPFRNLSTPAFLRLAQHRTTIPVLLAACLPTVDCWETSHSRNLQISSQFVQLSLEISILVV